MNKGTDLIQRQQIEIIDGYPTGNIFIGVTQEELTELEKELEVLEIIKEHFVNLGGTKGNFEGKKPTNEIVIELKDLTLEKFDLLKKVLYAIYER